MKKLYMCPHCGAFCEKKEQHGLELLCAECYNKFETEDALAELTVKQKVLDEKFRKSIRKEWFAYRFGRWIG